MKRLGLILCATALCCSALAMAQKGPESLLPPGFDKPASKPQPRAAEARPAEPAREGGAPAVASPAGSDVPVAAASAAVPLPANIPSLDKLKTMTPEELAELIGNRTRIDMPAGSRRAMKNLGIIDASEGGLPAWSLAHQNPSLVGAILTGNRGELVSRWGHILLRRALASRMDAPNGMAPADFAALRTALLVRMGEGAAARALAQDIDAANYTPELTQAAIDAYVLTADITGACPMVIVQGGARKDAQWHVLQAVCDAFASNGTRGVKQLDRVGPGEGFEQIDLLLAQKYAGAAGKAQRAVTIEWDGVSAMTPWRYGLALTVGLEPPAATTDHAPAMLRAMPASIPAASLAVRAQATDYAGGLGILSSAAMVDLYSQTWSLGGTDAISQRAVQLQSAYLATAPADRVAAMKQLWGTGDGLPRYSAQVLTAYAAARLPADAQWADEAPDLIASMLAAGLDANALRWGSVVPDGSLGWGMLALVQPARRNEVSADQIKTFNGADKSSEGRKTAFLIAGLAGLGRLPVATAADLSKQYGFTLDRPSRWTGLIDSAADVHNPTLVALLAGLGMQGESWARMTPRNLYHIVSALDRVGLSAEARMIAAEAVARG